MFSKRAAKVTPPESESDSDEETSSEEEEEPNSNSNPSALVSKEPVSNGSESSSESGSEDESESESDPDEENVLPIASKPMQDGTSKGKKQPLSPPWKITPSAAVKSGGKRLADESVDGTGSKKAAKKSKGEEGDAVQEEATKSGGESKKLFQRVWTEDDEIAVLKGMADFSSEKGGDPCASMFAFHEFIKKSLHFDVSKVQLADKIYRLKKKYKNNFNRAKNGENPTFSKPHDELAYELSKKLWGGGGFSEKVASGKSKSKDKGKSGKNLNSVKAGLFPAPVVNSGLSFCFTGLTQFQQVTQVGLDEQVVKGGVEMMEPSQRAELEERWVALQKDEIQLAAKKAELAMETARAIWEAFD